MNQQENKAGTELIVSKLTVLEGISGGGIEEIRQDVEMIQSSVQTMGGKQNDYWSSLSKDGVITPVEKRQLKKEYGTIDATHTALMAQAREKGVDTSSEVWAYDTAFEDLHDYLFIQLKLFDNMAENTELDSSETFNGYYNELYKALQNAQAKVNIGDPGKIRKLNSLQDLGNDGEVALFEDNFYYYDLANHEWIGISVASKLGEYMGVLTESPPQVLNQYFLVGPEGIYTDWLEITGNSRAAEENAWVDEYGEVIYINMGFETGYIYYWSENNEFVKVEDKNNWRYIVAMNDMIACHYDISPQLYEWLTGELAEELSKDVEEKVLEHSPKNLGQASAVPLNPNDGDWMVWAAASTSRFTKGHVYVYEKETVSWRELNPSDLTGKVRDMFMSSLTDILQVNPTESGYFSYIFAQAFFGNSATINSLRTYQAVIEEGGYIKSDNFVSGQSGWILNDKGAQLNSIVILDYATSEELSAVDGKADSAQTAADTAQGTADDAVTAAENAQRTADDAATAAGTAQTTADDAASSAATANNGIVDILEGKSSLNSLNGTIMRDLNHPADWAIRTENFDPYTSEKGFGITKSGDVYGNNVLLRGEIESINFDKNKGTGYSIRQPHGDRTSEVYFDRIFLASGGIYRWDDHPSFMYINGLNICEGFLQNFKGVAYSYFTTRDVRSVFYQADYIWENAARITVFAWKFSGYLQYSSRDMSGAILKSLEFDHISFEDIYDYQIHKIIFRKLDKSVAYIKRDDQRVFDPSTDNPISSSGSSEFVYIYWAV